MRLINRTKVTEFLHQNDSLVHPAQGIQDYKMDGDDSFGSEEHLHWADELIDEEIKSLLAVKSNGSQIPLDLIAHFEYFYNTLDCQFKPENPFEKPKKHPALLYIDQTTSMTNSPIKAMTLLEKHRHVIFPNSETAT